MNKERLENLIRRRDVLFVETERLNNYAKKLKADIDEASEINAQLNISNDKKLLANIRHWNSICKQVQHNRNKLSSLDFKIVNDKII